MYLGLRDTGNTLREISISSACLKVVSNMPTEAPLIAAAPPAMDTTGVPAASPPTTAPPVAAATNTQHQNQQPLDRNSRYVAAMAQHILPRAPIPTQQQQQQQLIAMQQQHLQLEMQQQHNNRRRRKRSRSGLLQQNNSTRRTVQQSQTAVNNITCLIKQPANKVNFNSRSL